MGRMIYSVGNMAGGYFTLLTHDELERIHEISLKILQEVGVKILSGKVQALLAEWGAEVDSKHSIVKIPEMLVKEALRRAPKEIVLCGRDPKFDIKLPSKDIPFVATGGYTSFVRDIETGERRASRMEDLRDFAVLSDFLDQVDFFWPIVAPTDLPPALQTVYGLAISFECTSKHVQYQALNERQARWQIKLASAIVGGEEKLRKRPIFSSVNCPVTPLVFEKGSSEAMIELAKAGIPVIPYSMPLCGSTAPATIAGTLTILNVENLAALVILECANPGAPMIYGGEASSADMRTAEINYKAPEYPLLTAGITQLGRFYGLPVYAGACWLNETPKDWGMLIKGSISIALMHLGRQDISAGLGNVEDAKSSALEQVILDAEAWAHAKAYLRTFKVDEDTLGFDVISRVGPGRTFLAEKHTLKHFREELWLRREPVILPSTDNIVKVAKEKVKEILRMHTPTPLEGDVRREIERILQQCKQELI
jgi:trimethylamine--corrinoid protein Co-methyltransferase